MDTKIKREKILQEHQLILTVLGKKKDKSYGGTWAGKEYYRLTVEVETPPKWKHIKEIFAFKERIQEESIWKEIMEDDYFDKRKLVICSKYSATLSILRWKDRPLNKNSEQKEKEKI